MNVCLFITTWFRLGYNYPVWCTNTHSQTVCSRFAFGPAENVDVLTRSGAGGAPLTPPVTHGRGSTTRRRLSVAAWLSD